MTLHIYIYINIYENKAERVFLMTRLFLFHIYKTRVFMTRSFLLYNNGRFYNACCFFNSELTNSEAY